MAQTALCAYDAFPYALAGEIWENSNGYVYIKGYGGHRFSNIRMKILPEDETLKPRIESVRERFIEAQKKLRLTWEHIAIQEIPELKQLGKWEEWLKENEEDSET